MLTKFKPYLNNRRFIISAGLGIVLLIMSLVTNFYAVSYATEKASNPVTDIVLDNTPLVDVDGLSVYGPILLWVFVGYLCLREPNKIPFILKSIALFVFIRCVFVSLTHIGPFPDQIHSITGLNFIQRLTFGGDLFFSGHTGLPFLMALTFHQNRRLFVFFSATAVFFGIIVLIAHLHYTIDVISAFFITFAIYHLAAYLFKKDLRIFNTGLFT